MMGIVMPETCWACKKYNKIISGIKLVFILQLSQWCTVQQISKFFLEIRDTETAIRYYFSINYHAYNSF